MHTLTELFAAWDTYCRMYDAAETREMRSLYNRLVLDFTLAIIRRMT